MHFIIDISVFMELKELLSSSRIFFTTSKKMKLLVKYHSLTHIPTKWIWILSWQWSVENKLQRSENPRLCETKKISSFQYVHLNAQNELSFLWIFQKIGLGQIFEENDLFCFCYLKIEILGIFVIPFFVFTCAACTLKT